MGLTQLAGTRLHGEPIPVALSCLVMEEPSLEEACGHWGCSSHMIGGGDRWRVAVEDTGPALHMGGSRGSSSQRGSLFG